MSKKEAEIRLMHDFALTRAEGDEPEQYRAGGYATTFNDPYVLWTDDDGTKYVEIIDRHALDGADMSDVIMQYDHAGKVLARISNGTLQLREDEHGFAVDADLSKSQAARDLHEEIRNGLITRMSWAFTVGADRYEHDRDNKIYTRIIMRVRKVYDVSAVSLPADPNTFIHARSGFDGVIEDERRSDRELLKMKMKLKLGGIMQ